MSWSLDSPSNLRMLADSCSFVFGVVVLLWCFDVCIVGDVFFFWFISKVLIYSANLSMLSPSLFSYSSSSSGVDSFVKNVGSSYILTSFSNAAGVCTSFENRELILDLMVS